MPSQCIKLILGETTNSNLDLISYLRTDDVDPRRNAYLIPKWAKSTGIDLDDRDSSNAVEYDELPEEYQDQFRDWLMQNYANEVPVADQDANLFFDQAQRVKSSAWLVHFTDPRSAAEIMDTGFIYGAEQDTMHLTKRYDRGQDEGPWVFAYVADSTAAESAARSANYGTSAILFQSSAAVKARHLGDDEEQVIVDRRLPLRNVMRLQSTGRGGKWWVGNKDRVYFTGAFSKVVQWVIDNYDQYRARFSTASTS